MTSRTFLRFAGWAALSSAVAIVLMVATAILGSTLRLGNTSWRWRCISSCARWRQP